MTDPTAHLGRETVMANQMLPSETKPTPDPTILTTEQLLREVGNSLLLMRAEMAGMTKERDAKLVAVDVKFAAVEREFELIEARRQEQKVDTKTAVDAALAAAEKAFRDQTANQEKAIQKSETASIEQAKQQNATFSASLQAIADTLADVKDRVGAIEARALGAAENRIDHRQNSAGMWAVIGGVGGLILLAIVILGFIEAYNSGP